MENVVTECSPQEGICPLMDGAAFSVHLVELPEKNLYWGGNAHLEKGSSYTIWCSLLQSCGCDYVLGGLEHRLER